MGGCRRWWLSAVCFFDGFGLLQRWPTGLTGFLTWPLGHGRTAKHYQHRSITFYYPYYYLMVGPFQKGVWPSNMVRPLRNGLATKMLRNHEPFALRLAPKWNGSVVHRLGLTACVGPGDYGIPLRELVSWPS